MPNIIWYELKHMEVGGDGWVEPQSSDAPLVKCARAGPAVAGNMHQFLTFGCVLAGPAGVGNNHPFLSGGIADDVVHFHRISGFPAAAKQESIAAVHDVSALIFGQERQGGVDQRRACS